MMIHQITPFVDYNYWLKRLETQLMKSTNQNPMEVPKLLSQQIRKRYYKTSGTSVINSPMSPPLLSYMASIVKKFRLMKKY